MKKPYLLLLLLLGLSCTDTPRSTLKFTEQTYRGKWPFSVDAIEVYCNGYREIYCEASNGKTYALNGSAKGISQNNPSMSKIEEIWQDDPDWPGLKISYQYFISEGLKICEHQ